MDAISTWDDTTGAMTVFLVNRVLDTPTKVTIDVSGFGTLTLDECQGVHDADVGAVNDLENPTRVAPTVNPTARIDGGVVTLELPAVSWTVLTLEG